MSTAKKGRKTGEPMQLVGPQMDRSAPQADQEMLALVNTTLAGYGADRDLLNQMAGEVKMARAYEEFSRTLRVSKLAQIKESKMYRALEGRAMPDGAGRMTGTWEEFCVHCVGVSVEKIDSDIRNYKAFGEEALDAMNGAGIGYRELSQLRRVPDDERAALVEVAKAGTAEQLRELAEQLIQKHLQEKQQLETQLRESHEDITTKDERASKREKDIERLEGKVRKVTRELKDADPDDVATKLREAVVGCSLGIRGQILAYAEKGEPVHSLRTHFAALVEHGETTGVDHKDFLAGVIGELLGDLRRLRDRDEFLLPIVNDANHA